jgi:hypothetical protein
MKRLLLLTLLVPILASAMEQPPQPPCKTKQQKSTYAWIKCILLTSEQKTLSLKNRTKLTVKTVSADWVDTHEPVILIFSIHTKFHEGPIGELQSKSLIESIKEHIKGKIVVLFPEHAHTKANSLKYNNNEQRAFDACSKDARALAERLKPYLTGCDVHFWNTLISNDSGYAAAQEKVKHLYTIDKKFQQLLRADAEGHYSPAWASEVPDKELFIKKTTEDIMEQIAYLFIVTNKGYKFEFYPGKPNPSSEYINQTCIKPENQLKRVPVFLHFE